MDASHHSAALDKLLDAALPDGRTQTKPDLLREAAEMGVPQALLARLQLLPDREYDRDQLLRALPPEENLWRSDMRVPLAELDQALATYSFDGEVDDESGNDVGAEELRQEQPLRGPAEGGDPDPDTVEGRRLKPSFDGRPGPH